MARVHRPECGYAACMADARVSRWCRAIALVLSVSITATGSAQMAEPPALGDIVVAVEYARLITGFSQHAPQADAVLVRNLRKLIESRVLTRPLAEVERDAAGRGLLARAREQQSRYDFGIPDNLTDVIDTIVMIVNGEMREPLGRAASEVELARIRAPFDQLADVQLAASMSKSARALERYERMYGPGSVQLNLVETGLNYAAQWLPGFGVDKEHGPLPLELVSSWSPMYLTYAAGHAEAVSVFEAGVRSYIFRSDWGKAGGLRSILKPGHVTAGVAVAPEGDAVMRNPFTSASRMGVFLAYGTIKVAWVGSGDDSRFLLSREMRIIPFVF